MDNKKNLLPEYVWMIFVGILLAIIILMQITPGRADESTSPSATPIPTSALDPTDACLVVGIHESDYLLFTLSGSEISSLSTSELYEQAYFVRYGSAGDSTLFLRDVKIALTQLKAQFQGFFVSIIDLGASVNAYNAMYLAISDVGVPISQGYLDYSQNRVLQMVNTNFINAPVWVWNSNIPTPTPSPTPAPSESNFFYFHWKDYYESQYFLVEIEASDFGFTHNISSFTDQINYISSQFNKVPETLSGVSVFVRSGTTNTWDLPTVEKSALFIYFTASSVSSVKLYSLGSSSASLDLSPDFITSNFTPSLLGASGYDSFAQDPSYSFVYGLGFSHEIRYNKNYERTYYFDKFLNVEYRDTSVSSTSRFQSNNGYYYLFQDSYRGILTPSYYGFIGLLSFVDNVNNPYITPTAAPPIPSPTSEPLPTSGESIHVILPTGSPTPTPPFSVSPGDGSGSIGGGGLGSGETSGILQSFSLYVADNPVFAFLSGLFSAFPAGLMYPLYILLFILLLLGVIRLFIHFTGG